MEPGEFELLAQVARRRGSSVADLVREATRAQFLADIHGAHRSRSAQSFLDLPDASLPEWDTLKREIEGRYDKDVP